MTETTDTDKAPTHQHSGMDDDEIAHLAGIVDAIGSITVSISREDDYAVGYRYRPAVRIRRPNEDQTLFGKLDAYCEDNSIRYDLSEREDTVTFEVDDVESIKRFLVPLLPWLVSKNIEAWTMVDQIIPRVAAEEHKTREGFYELMEYADTLRENVRYGNDPKYTQAHFADLWEEVS